MDTTELIGLIKGWHGIYDPANEDAITNAEALNWINMARRRYCRQFRLRFSEYEDSFATVVGQRTYDLADGWMSFESLYYFDDDDKQKSLEWFSSKQRFDQRFPDRTEQGTVVGAVQWGNLLLLGLVPDEVITIYVSGHKIVDDLALGGSDGMLTEMWEGIMWSALVISGEYHTVPEAKHTEWKNKAAAEESVLKTLYRTAKTPPSRIITQRPGTFTSRFEEED